MTESFSSRRFNTSRFAALRGAAAAILFAAGLSACASGNLPVTDVQSTNNALTDGYRVAAGDKLRITVFDEEALTGEYEIGDGGVLSMPLIDTIAADGKTPVELSGLITEKLKEGGYVLIPRVSVEIVSHRPFFILGEVANPGEYAYSGELTLEQAVAKAGGYTPRAEKGVVTLRRQDWTSPRRVKLGGPSLKIAPGDTITIAEAFF
jgi:polysaccharide export outer membrane protein